jgi:hypothetical protein
MSCLLNLEAFGGFPAACCRIAPLDDHLADLSSSIHERLSFQASLLILRWLRTFDIEHAVSMAGIDSVDGGFSLRTAQSGSSATPHRETGNWRQMPTMVLHQEI